MAKIALVAAGLLITGALGYGMMVFLGDDGPVETEEIETRPPVRYAPEPKPVGRDTAKGMALTRPEPPVAETQRRPDLEADLAAGLGRLKGRVRLAEAIAEARLPVQVRMERNTGRSVDRRTVRMTPEGDFEARSLTAGDWELVVFLQQREVQRIPNLIVEGGQIAAPEAISDVIVGENLSWGEVVVRNDKGEYVKGATVNYDDSGEPEARSDENGARDRGGRGGRNRTRSRTRGAIARTDEKGMSHRLIDLNKPVNVKITMRGYEDQVFANARFPLDVTIFPGDSSSERSRERGGRTGRGGRNRRDNRELPEAMRTFDLDGDGKLSDTERKAAKKALGGKRERGGRRRGGDTGNGTANDAGAGAGAGGRRQRRDG